MVFSLSIVVQGLAVYLALRTMVSSRVRWAWGAIAIALALILPRRLITTFMVFQQPAPFDFLPWSVFPRVVHLLLSWLGPPSALLPPKRGRCGTRRLSRQDMGSEAKLRAAIQQQEGDQTSQQNEKSFWRFFDSIDDFLFVLDEQKRI